MKKLTLLFFLLFFAASLIHAKTPPGIAIGSYSITIPLKYFNNFIKGSQPDSFIFIHGPIVKRYTGTSKDTLYASEYSFNRNAKLEEYKQVIDFLIETRNYESFRAFIKNGQGDIYKFVDYLPNGVVKREVILIDPKEIVLEVTNYYKDNIVLSRTRMKSIPPTNNKNIDSLWYGYKPFLVQSGNQTVFYPDGTVKSVRSFEDDKMVRKVKDTIIKQDLFGNKVNYGQRKALLIGIDTYAPPKNENFPIKRITFWSDLAGCVNDVNGLHSVLSSKQNFRKENINTIVNEFATKQGILSAFNKLIESLRMGDFVFIHFSGHSQYISNEKPDSLNFELLCRDKYKENFENSDIGSISQKELDLLFVQIKSKIGQDGQLIFSLDASTGGSEMKNNNESGKSDSATFRGESSSLLFNFNNKDEAAFTFFTSAAPNETGKEMLDETGKPFGAYSLALIRALANEEATTIPDLFNAINARIVNAKKNQKPQYYSNFNQLLFETTLFSAKRSLVALPQLKQSGNAYVISTGISKYNTVNVSNLKFTNCVSDAITYSNFFKNQYNQISGGKHINTLLLTDSFATKESILKAINDAISNSKADDYFIFNFSGYCRPLKDSNGKQVTYFVPYGLKNIGDSVEIKKNGISLTQLKDLLQLIPANNQLFITEAGSTNDFQKEFIQALIETSPTIASLSNKNRVFIVPRSSGLDKFYCNNVSVEHGPLNYYITNLSRDLNIFGLFEGGVYADAVKYSINKEEVNCDYFKSGYFDIFFEKDYIKDLKYFLPEEIMQSRGLILKKEIKEVLDGGNSKKYALVVGTDKYEGKPDWNDLNNPVLDAMDVANELENGFGYKVKRLMDKPIDSFYAYISYLSTVMNKNDQLVIYVAGHGDFDDALFDDGFIVCRDSKITEKDPYRNTYIQYSKLSRMINKLPANQILMVLDVCFGGTFDERVARNEARSKNTEYDNLNNADYFAKKLQLKTRLYLTSGGKKEVPDGYRGKHSPFALKLLEALQTRGGNSKLLTGKDLHKFVERLPSGPLLGSFGDNDVGSEFLLLGN